MTSGGRGLVFPRVAASPPSRSSAAPWWSAPSRRACRARGWRPTASYGGDYALPLWLERQPLGYVLAVTSKRRAPSGFDSVKIRPTRCFGADDWQRLSAGEGAKGLTGPTRNTPPF